MSEIIQSAASSLPAPSVPMSVRVGTRDDMPFMDALQKQHSKALGFFPRAQMEAYIDAGNVLIAEVAGSSQPSACGSQSSACSELNPASCKPEAVGYCISKDRYLKRDELGAVFQLCVAPGKQRGFIGANLLREVFERAAYGCKLFCCWCAQDLPANRFWEAMGFVPIAYRCGGKSKVRKSKAEMSAGDRDSELRTSDFAFRTSSHRIHIFWQKRIRAGDNSTPFWFPAKTEGGAIREDRIILPIPPGMKWDEELPVLVVPAITTTDAPTLPGKTERAPRTEKKPFRVTLGAPIHFAPPEPDMSAKTPRAKREKVKADRVKAKADPQVIAKARELRDKWMDHASAGDIGLVDAGKYDVSRRIESHDTPRRISASSSPLAA